MANDDYTTHLSELEGDYQVLTELHRTANSRSYLARHLKLNRDVTITVVRAAGDRSSLKRFADDVARMKSTRHANVIPVIEGRWLGNDAFAVVRARVRGSTLDQLVSAVGPLPLPRIAATLGDVRSALDWARTSGITNRTIAPDAMIFQQGSGRVLLPLDPTSAPVTDACDDTRTIGRLAWEMLAGRPFTNASASSLGAMRPDLSSSVVAETEAMVRCTRGAPRDVSAYLALLTAAPGAPGAGAAVADVPAPASRMVVAEPTPLYSKPVSTIVPLSPAVVPVRQSWSFNARLATAVAVIAVIFVVALLFMHSRTRSVVDRTAINDQSRAPAGEAAGDVALHSQPLDTSMLTTPAPAKTRTVAVTPSTSPLNAPITSGANGASVSPANSQPSSAPMPAPIGGPSPTVVPRSPIAPPDTRRHEPLHAPPRVLLPSASVPGTRDVGIPADGTQPDNNAAANGDACSSPAASEQHRCLMSEIDRNDGQLNVVYRQLIGALRRQANTASGDPEPESVTSLRQSQRQWVDTRDHACRNVGTAPLYARDRAQCFADQSAKRAREMQQRLDAVPQG